MILIILDRDGTIIKRREFLGKNDNWREEIELNEDLIECLKIIDTKYKSKKIVITNQAGVARNLFSEDRVKEINEYIHNSLKKTNIHIDDWEYCPYVDRKYAESSKLEFNEDYVSEKTKRKPSTFMVFDALNKLNLSLKDFDKIIVFGDREEDDELAKNLNTKFIDVKNKTKENLIKKFTEFVKKN